MSIWNRPHNTSLQFLLIRSGNIDESGYSIKVLLDHEEPFHHLYSMDLKSFLLKELHAIFSILDLRKNTHPLWVSFSCSLYTGWVGHTVMLMHTGKPNNSDEIPRGVSSSLHYYGLTSSSCLVHYDHVCVDAWKAWLAAAAWCNQTKSFSRSQLDLSQKSVVFLDVGCGKKTAFSLQCRIQCGTSLERR